MAKLMPGRVRHEGLALYNDGQVIPEDFGGSVHQFKVADFSVSYDSSDRFNHCSCPLFTDKNYCAHLAAVESFLKHAQNQMSTRDDKQLVQHQKREEHLFASRFLEALKPSNLSEVTYALAAFGEYQAYSNQMLWTLKIQRLPDQRFYIIRDLPAFLRVVEQQKAYQIGKNYYERLTVEHFDAASQAVIVFLTKLVFGASQMLCHHDGRYLSLPAGFFAEGLSLLGALSTFSLTGLASYELTVPLVRPLTAQEGLFHFNVTLDLDEVELVICESASHQFFDGQYLYHQGGFYGLDRRQQRLFKAIQNLPLDAAWRKCLRFDLADQARLAEQLVDFACLGPVNAPKSFVIRPFSPCFSLTRYGDHLEISLTFLYDDGEVASQEAFDQLPFVSDPDLKARIDRTLKLLGFQPTFRSRRLMPQGAELFEFLAHGLAQLGQIGQVTLSEDIESLWQVERPGIHLDKTGGLLEVTFDFSGLDPVDIKQAMISLQEQDAYFIGRSGQVVVFDDEVKRIAQVLINLRAKASLKQRFQLPSLASLQLKQALSTYDQVHFSAELEEMTAHLANPETFNLPQLPISAHLRGYQKRGIQWLAVLDHYGFGGILADDMGLGKTLQTIAFLASRLAEGKKVLILAPSSLIYNWQEEFVKFYPEAWVCVVEGNKKQRHSLIATQASVTVASYSSFRQDLQTYQAYHYDYLILDEAQVLKNSQTKIANSLREFGVARCFALSGTPIENALLEIWSIFQIVLPGLFASKSQFNSLSAKEVARIIQPFVLRRKKEDVLPELPDVTEVIYYTEMSREQKVIYLAQLERMRQLLVTTTPSDFVRHKIEILSGITRLRQICNTPKLFMPYDGGSGKLASLGELLVQLKENGHRALIFSQFRSMLDLVAHQLADLGLSSYMLTGSTPVKQRQAMTSAFNKGSRDAFLMSLKAGGVGLNVTGADTVILIDLWWNPAVDLQAVGRAHRLGQEKAVQVYRLITKGSIEEKILDLQESKRHLLKEVLEGDHQRSSLTLDELKQILGLSE